LSANDYQGSGVDLEAMNVLKERIKAYSAMTHGPEVLGAGGSFAGLYQLSGLRQPVLVASADGVGTKLKIASLLGHYESIGQDLVTLNVNDILTRGARPLFFLDYISFTAHDDQRMDTLMRGITWGCREAGCALIGGETAQLPNLYQGDDFDLAGFVVGVVERDEVIDGNTIQSDDYLVGFPSSGVHTNGFSLVRSVFKIDEHPSVLFRRYDELNHQLGEELLIQHQAYYPSLNPILKLVKGLAHITGGGLPGKMSAILPTTMTASFQRGSWIEPSIFSIIQREGHVSSEEMFRVFNMGLGMVAVCAETNVNSILAKVSDARVVGRIIPRGDQECVVFTDN
jgi:phosphoribosylformylglycinamidine cyclo-ligase